MNTREKLFEEVEATCKTTGLDFATISSDLSDFVGGEEVIDYYIARSPLPSFPNTVFNVMLLSAKSIYDYEVKQKGVLHHILPLRSIIEIGEKLVGEDNEFLSVHFDSGGLSGLASECKLSESENLRKFASVVRKRVLESI